jgi:VWFA-related protein
VRVDVVAIDEEGRFVDDLNTGELRVLEDEVPQEIISLQLVDVGEGRIYTRGTSGPGFAGGPIDTDPAVETDAVEVPGGLPAIVAETARSDLGAVIYLVDGLGLSARNLVRFSMRWSAELGKRQGLAVPHALYRVDRSGQVREIVSLTEDIAVLRSGVERIATFADTDLFRGLRIREPSLQRFDLLKQFCEALAGRQGRTVLVFVSTGVSLMKRGSPDTRVLKLQAEMHESANASNVTFYGLDPSLMYEIIGTGVDMSRQIDTSMRVRAGSGRDEIGNSLRHAAAATGGRAFIGWGDLDRVIDRIEQDTNRYYLLTYSPRRTESDGAYHALKVEVTRPGVRVRFRQGYIDDPSDVRESKRLSGALSLPGATGSIPMSVEVFRRRSPTGDPHHSVRISANAAAFRATLADDGSRVVRVTAHVGVATAGGETIFYRSESATHELGRDGNDPVGGEGPMADMLSHSETISLPPGEYELKVAFVDQNGDSIGAESADLTVPPDDVPWPTSSLTLVWRPDSGAPRPVIGGQVAAGERVTGTLDVYAPDEVALSARLVGPYGSAVIAERFAAGPQGSTVPSQDLPLLLERNAGGVGRASLEVPRLPAGEYVIEVQIDGSDGSEVLRSSLHVAAR